MRKIIDTLKKSPSRYKAIYLLWATFHLILFVTSGNFITYHRSFFDFRMEFFPFEGGFSFEHYDLSEFIVYLVLPISLYYFIILWRKKEKTN